MASPIQQASLDMIRWFLPILPRLPRQHRPHRLHRLPRRHRRHRHRPRAFPFADTPLPLPLLCRGP
jgi:hypothetical protein